MPRTPHHLAAAAAASALTLLPAASASASPRTERFPLSADVAVHLRLSGPESGTLARFPRNRLTLTRARDGALVLHRGTRRSTSLTTSARRPVTVRLTLSARAARIAVGRRAASLAGRFVPEDALVVGAAHAAALQPSGATTGTASAAAPARPAAPAAPA